MKNGLVESEEMRYNVGGGLVAQLVRALPCHGRGREFESRRVRQDKTFTFVEVLSWMFSNETTRNTLATFVARVRPW